MQPRSLLAVCLLGWTCSVSDAQAEVHLPAIFSDHMVLQAGKPPVIWGTAAPREAVRVSFLGQDYETVADAAGHWQLRMAAAKPGGPHELVVRASHEIHLRDILVGEVWLGSGQSNMELPMQGAANPETEIPGASFEQIRLFHVAPVTKEQPLADLVGSWQVCTPETVADFSAVLYYFGREIHQKRRTPVGLIESAFGGTTIEAWMPRETLQACEEGRKSVARFDAEIANYETNYQGYLERLEGWKQRVQAAESAGRTPPRKPPAPLKRGDRKTPSGLCNAMIHPLVPYTLRGVLWYQGEKNARFFALPYRRLFPELIGTWRNLWGDPTLPFYFVQLPNLIQLKPEEHDWPTMRESQALALAIPNTGMAVTIDIGDPKDVHPKNKLDVGRRLALLARHRTYGESLIDSGPLYRTGHIDGQIAVLRFDSVGDRLLAVGDGRLTGFEVAGADGKFAPAEAKLDGDCVRVVVGRGDSGVTIRYAWRDNPTASLFNSAGLPAAPFRTFVAARSLFEETTVFPPSPRDRPNYRIPAILRSPGGDLLVFAEKRNEGPGDLGDHDLVMKRSRDLGRTWSDEQVLLDGGRLSNVDSSPLVDRSSGAIFLFFMLDKKQFAYLRSDDDGRTWTQPVVIHDAVTKAEWNEMGEDQRYGVGPGSGVVQLRVGSKAGRLLVPARHRELISKKSARSFSHVFYSDDHGATWRLGGTAAEDGNECQLVELTDGKVLLVMRDQDNSRRPDKLRQIVATSEDGGETWLPSSRDETLITPQVEACIMRFTTKGAQDKDRLLFSNPKSAFREEAHPYGRRNLAVRLSYDEGKTWSDGKTIYAGPSSYSNMVVLNDMTIGIVYERGPLGGQSYWDEVRFARFNLAWLTDGQDSLPGK